jgi:hypothetical protein
MAEIEVRRYAFDQGVVNQIEKEYFVQELWPVVYILSNGSKKEAYVGETTNAMARFQAHLKHPDKKKLTAVHLVESGKFNKSAALDIEANLIRYLSGEGKYTLLNSNIGIANHNYYQKDDLYWSMFERLWNVLIREGVAEKSLAEISNSDLFKYSPYKALAYNQIASMRNMMEALLNDPTKTILVEGGAGTGKTILATYLFKLLHADLSEFEDHEFGDDHELILDLAKALKLKYRNPRTALVVPMSSFRSTMQKVFKTVKGLKSSMVIGPADLSRNQYDIVLIDEAHRLRQRINLGSYFGAFDNANKRLGLPKLEGTELDWVEKQADRSILFYDSMQSIRPSDVSKEKFDLLMQKPTTIIQRLKAQFRVKAGDDYVQFVRDLLRNKLDQHRGLYAPEGYDLKLYEDFGSLFQAIQDKNEQYQLCRVLAGYSWEWVSNKGADHDIEIDGVQVKWNTTNQDWINSKESINEVGCIHTSQGYDLNYTGLVFGHEITYNPELDQIEIIPENYYDKAGKVNVADPETLKAYIINIYQTMMLRGIHGTYVYACDPNLRVYLKRFIPVQTTEQAFKIIPLNELRPYENAIPKYNIKVAAGDFSPPQSVEDVEWVQLDNPKWNTRDYFICQVVGESMNRKVSNGSWCLFKRYTGGSRNGEIVLAQHHSLGNEGFGSGFTLKEYRSTKRETEESWEHTSIRLIPHSDNPSFEALELEGSQLEDFRVIGVLVEVL